MRNKVIVKSKKMLIINVLILIISIIFASYTSIEKLSINYERNLFIIGWIINIYFILSIIMIYKQKGQILDNNIIFYFFIFIFCNGQVFLYTMGVDIEHLSVLNISTNVQVIKEIVYFYFSMLFYQIGVSLTINKDNTKPEIINNKLYINAIKITAAIMLACSIFPFFYILIPRVKNSILYGYNYLYTNAIEYSGIFGYSAKLFIPSLLLLLYAYKEDKKYYCFFNIILILISVLDLIIGSRGDSLSILIILILFYNLYKKKFEGKKLVKLAIIGCFFLIIIPVIADFRGVEKKNIDSLINIVEENLFDSEENFVIKTISELGYTMHAYILTDMLVPTTVNYKYGESYISSFIMLIPSQLTFGYSFAEKAALDTWLQKSHKLSYGPGYSIIAETYYNFGYTGGMIFAIVLGMFYSYFLNLKSKDSNKNELLRLLSLIFLFNSLIAARFPFHSTPRNIFYMLVIPYLLVNIIYGNLKRKAYYSDTAKDMENGIAK